MWQGIHGHDRVVERFRQSLEHGRLASSYLFLGPEGVGKRTFALKLAQALLCQFSSDEQLEPCENCESCRLFAAGNHPDLDVVSLPDGKNWLPVELFIGDRDHRNQVGLCHNISLRPVLGQRRVAIIDDADQLTTESSNCLLKTLEEPPPGAILILIGTSRARQLPTILSRTQIIRFNALSAEVLSKLLIQHNMVGDAIQAEKIAQTAQGSLARAQEYSNSELEESLARLKPLLNPLKFDARRLVNEVTDYVNSAGKEAGVRRQHIRKLLNYVGQYYRHFLHECCGNLELFHGKPTDIGQFIPVDIPLAAIDRCLEAEIQLDRNANQATLIECWLDDLAGIFLQVDSTV